MSAFQFAIALLVKPDCQIASPAQPFVVFIMVDDSASEPRPTELVLVRNWFQELERLVPSGHECAKPRVFKPNAIDPGAGRHVERLAVGVTER